MPKMKCALVSWGCCLLFVLFHGRLLPPIPQPSRKLIILHPQLVPVPVAFSLLRVQVSSETSQPSRKEKLSLLSGPGLYLYSSESHT